MKPIHLRAALLAAFVVLVAACGGGGPSADDPAGSVSSALTAVSGGGFSKLADFTCAAKKGDIANALGGGAGGMAQLEKAGVKADDLFNAMTITFANVSAKETSRNGTTATVHVTGDMTLTFDKDKMRAIMKQVLTTQGLPADDATVDTAMGAMGSQLTQTQHLDEDIAVTNEAGKWLICG